MPRVARASDSVAHGGECSELVNGWADVLVEGEPVATVDTPCTHAGTVNGGSPSVFVHGKPLARKGDTVSCGGTIEGPCAQHVFVDEGGLDGSSGGGGGAAGSRGGGAAGGGTRSIGQASRSWAKVL